MSKRSLLGNSRSNGRRFESPRLIVVLVVASLMTAGLVVATSTAAVAVNGPGAADLINQKQLNDTALYAASAAQQSALADLSQQAVANTLTDHSLAAGDAAAAQTWGRSDAEAELWALLTQAIETPAASRSSDQQNAVAWLTAVQQRQDVSAAQDAGLEYAKWAGLGATAYRNLLATHPSEASLESFLSGSPVGYTGGEGPATPSSTDNEGYCAYVSPAPFQTEYTANIYTPFAQSTAPQTCFSQCTSLLGCPPPTPSYDQFVHWGVADADGQLDTGQFAAVSNSVAEALGFGGAVVGAGVTGVALSAALSGALTGTTLAAALSPFGGITGGAVGGLGTAALADASAGIAAAEVAGFAAIVIIAIAIAVVETINIVSAAALPGQLATAITNAATTVPALGAILADPSQAPGLFSLFIGATLPEPTLTGCDNSFLISTIPVPNPAPCLNAPVIPAATSSDPVFTVTQKGSTSSTVVGSIGFADATAQTTNTARVSGHWFVQHETATSDGSSITFLALELHYTDWSGREEIAWLLGNVTSGIAFVTAAAGTSGATNPTACLGAGTCSSGPALQYVGTDGNDYSATLGAPPPPPPPVYPGGIPPVPTNTFSPGHGTSTSVSVSPALPVVNQPVTLTALVNNFLISNYAGSVSFVDSEAGNATTLCANVAVTGADWVLIGESGGAQVYQIEAIATCTATFTTTGPHDIYATYDGSAADFQSSQAKVTINVLAVAPPPTVMASGAQTFGAASSSFTYTDDASAPTTVTGTLTCTTVDGGTAIGAALPGGVHTVDGSSCSGLSASGGVSVVYQGATGGYVVAPAGQTMSFAAPATGVVGASAVLAPTPGASNNPVVLGVDATSDPGVCSVAALTVSYLAPGNCVIDADEAGNANYLAAPRITQTITVNQAPAFVLAGAPTTAASNQPYDYTFAASGSPAPTYSLAAGAPTWLSIDAGSGTVSGTPPTTTKTFTYSVIASNVAGASTAGPFKVSVVKTVVSVDLSISASCPTSLKVATSGTCTLTVKNASNTAIGNISAALLVPAALSKVSCTAGCVAHRNLFTWSIAALKAGATTTLTITVKAVRPANVGLLAAVVSPDPDPNPRNNIAAQVITIKRA